MPKLPSSNPKQFVQGAPVLHVSDVIATAAFYRDVLGFMWDFGDQSYAVVWRDNSAIHFVRDDASPKGVQLMLNTAYEEGTRPPEPVRVHGHSDIGLFFSSPDLDATYAYLRSQGI